MKRFGISLEDLKSGSVPTISNIPTGLVLALFGVVKSKKELKIEELVAENLWGILEQVFFQRFINW